MKKSFLTTIESGEECRFVKKSFVSLVSGSGIAETARKPTEREYRAITQLNLLPTINE